MFKHTTVLLYEAVDGLDIKENGIYVDCTLGGAGHSILIASKLGEEGKLFSLDQDDHALEAAKDRLQKYGDQVTLIKTNFRLLKQVLNERGIYEIDGVLFDLGVSSPQLDEGERGFSYHYDAPLDMRMDQTQELTAEIIVNTWPEQDLTRIIYQYGEEKFSRQIAKKIVQHRSEKQIKTTGELVELIKEAIPAPARRSGPHPARRTFQAIRIAVNDELNAFEQALKDAIEMLRPQGRASVITFHSLEDRICKKVFSDFAQGCICPPDFPVCTCGQQPEVKIITKKPIIPTEQEIADNQRARSAKLRIAEKL
ncbi:16S rRNA (cytosine(1402)-N(4))-methyltransferase RsmH [Tepidibacillus infernus]|uniref:Ribosomal RNA small subunit methyltransferase H n=1 Tax=Tepidibacillus decaturensis TaxID=1413211 RepID=A0A135L4D2_9BACI|nr:MULTISPECIES: 16S rRNA (cytosine(1402)-N(4))-methyltransferase RsmH [Tepidibacillus]KXG43779.1 ribosomal RNA small subunit methyltransferase H [Tepidibacillus decaturensis]GBF11987.1 ribosomal RNA small subunit methyltransferase H [Tepidibacillus sp. HK-1]